MRVKLIDKKWSISTKMLPSKPGELAKLALEPGTRVTVEFDPSMVTRQGGALKEKQAVLKAVRKGAHLIVEADGQELLEITDFYMTADASLDSLQWAGQAIEDASPVGAERSVSTAVPAQDAVRAGVGGLEVGASESAALRNMNKVDFGLFKQIGGFLSAAGLFNPEAKATVVELDTAQNMLQGTIVAGPVVAGNELQVKIFNASGQQIATAQVDANGRYEAALGNYSGLVFVLVVDGGEGADYVDEVTKAPIDLSGNLLAAGVVVGGNTPQTLNINPMTTAAAMKAGLRPTPDGAGVVSTAGVDAAKVESANQVVAKALLGDGTINLLTAEVIPTVDVGGNVNSNANDYGKVLAALAGMDAVNDGDSTRTLKMVVDGITEAGAVYASLLSALKEGARRASVQGELPFEATPTQDRAGSIAAISGTVTQGQVLTAGAITDADGGVTGITYQWKAAGVDISGATSNNYTLTQAEVGKSITVVATYTDAHGLGKTVTSAATAAVVNVNDAPVAGTVSISGTAEEGGTLTATPTGFTDPDGTTPTYTYQWQIADTADGTYSNIANATSETYAIASDQSQVGKFFKVVVIGTDGTLSTPALTSGATTVVLNVNDAPEITSLATASVAENAAITTVVYTAVATDVDGDMLSYSLAGTDAALFAINASTGVVTLRASANYEAKDSYSFDVMVTDSGTGSLTDTKAVTVNVNDVKEQSIWSVDASPLVVYEGAGTATFVVSRTDAAVSETIQFATGGGDATAGSDYTAVSQTLNFAAGEMSKTVTVAISDDNSPEPNETLTGNISNASAGSIAAYSATVTINDNDQSIWSVEASTPDVNEGAGTVNFVVSRTGATGAATIHFGTGGGSASAGSDYTAVSQTLSFAAGEMSKTVTVPILTDALLEANETFVASISNASAGSIAASNTTVTIIEQAQSVWSIITGTPVIDEGAGFAFFTVSRTGMSGAATVRVVTGLGTALPEVDYTAFNQVLSFASGEMSKTVQVAINDDASAENNETFTAFLTELSTGTAAQASSTATINDNEQSLWSVSGSDSAAEGSGFVRFTVSRTGPSAPAQITFNTVGGTASQGSDYTPVSQVLSFANGEMSKAIEVALVQDEFSEVNETFSGSISAPTVGIVAQGTSLMTIVDDDQSAWTISQSSANVSEGAGNITFTVTRTGATAASSIIFSATGSSAGSTDFVPLTQTLSFAEGEMSKTVTVNLVNDLLVEADETFLATITLPAGASGTISNSVITTTIVDDDSMQWAISAGTNALESSGFLTFNVTRTGNINAAAQISFLPGDGLATAGTDFAASAQVLAFLAGEASKTVFVPIIDDLLVEPNESVAGLILNPDSGIIKTGRATALILDDEQSVWTVSAVNGTVMEDSGFALLEVSRTGKVDEAATITLDVNGQMATKGVDFVWTPTVLSFAASEFSKIIKVPIVSDGLIEQRETVFAELSNASSGIIGSLFIADGSGGGAPSGSTATFSIVDPLSVTWSVSSVSSVLESSGSVMFIVTRDNVQSAGTVRFTTAGLSSAFFTPVDTVLSFAAGESSKLVSVQLIDNSIGDGNKSLTALLSEPSIGTIGSAQMASHTGVATVSILDEDQISWSVSTNAGQIDESSGFLAFTITRSGPLTAATVDFATIGGTALPGTDYTPVSRRLAFAEGQNSVTLQVPVIDDAIVEGTNTIVGWIGNPSLGNIGTSSATGTLTDNDSPVWVLASRGNVDEGAGIAWYSVSRTTSRTAETIVATGIFTDQAGIQQTISQTLSFAVGENYKAFSVPLIDDTLPDRHLNLSLYLTDPSAGTVARSNLGVSVSDNDTATWQARLQTSPTEGSPGAFVIYRSGNPAAATIDVTVTTGAAQVADFTPGQTVRTISFATGEMAKVVLVSTLTDSVTELAEGVTFRLSNPSVGALQNFFASTVTINDANLAFPTFAVSAAPGGYESQGHVAVTFTRLGLLTGSDTVKYATANGTATAGADFTAMSGTLTFAPGEVSKVILIPLVVDNVAEGSENFTVRLSEPSSGVIATASATVTYTEVGTVGTTSYALTGGPAISDYLANGTINATENGQFMVVRVTRSGDTTAAGVSYLRTNGGTATAGTDYVALNRTLNWAPAETFKEFMVSMINDANNEGRESVIFEHSTSATFTSPVSNTLWIGDDDLSSAPASTYVLTGPGNMSESSTGSIVMQVRRVGNPTLTETIYMTVAGTGTTATAGADYVSPGVKEVTFRPYEMFQFVTVDLMEDTTAEANENLVISLYSTTTAAAAQGPTNGTTGRLATSTVTLFDDDWWMGTSGADTLNYSATSYRVNTGAGDDIFTVGKTAVASLTDIRLGEGNDQLVSTSASNTVVAGAVYDGGDGVDAIRFGGTAAYNIGTASTTVPLFTKFERLDMSTDTTVQTVNLTINDVLQMTKDNTIANLLQVWGQGTDKLALTTWGIAANTVNPSTSLTDVDGVIIASVVADTNANGINEVTFAGRVYEVYSFDYAGSSINLLVQQAIVTGGGMTFVI